MCNVVFGVVCLVCGVDFFCFVNQKNEETAEC